LQSDAIHVKIGELELIVETKYPALSDELYFDAANIAKRIKKEYKQTERARLAKEFTETTDEATRQKLSTEISTLNKEIEALKH
jgi:hypothetical protein